MAESRPVDREASPIAGLDPRCAILTVPVVLFALLAIWAEESGNLDLVYAFKPLTTALILVVAWLGPYAPSQKYRRAILTGLVFSLAGDVFLMLPSDQFLAGLVSFLLAHISYAIAFSSTKGFFRSPWSALLLAIYGAIIMAYLWPELGDMRVPALVYMLAILTMAWQAYGQWRQAETKRALLAMLGALLFVASDSVLALNRFGYPLQSASIAVLGTYYPAQWLISVSAGAARS